MHLQPRRVLNAFLRQLSAHSLPWCAVSCDPQHIPSTGTRTIFRGIHSCWAAISHARSDSLPPFSQRERVLAGPAAHAAASCAMLDFCTVRQQSVPAMFQTAGGSSQSQARPWSIASALSTHTCPHSALVLIHSGTPYAAAHLADVCRHPGNTARCTSGSCSIPLRRTPGAFVGGPQTQTVCRGG